MTKTAIFVEGQTELIFIREFLLKMFDYSNINIYCRTLFVNSQFQKAEYDFPENYNNDAEYLFQIINVGNDVAIVSRILKREKYLWNAGFNKIIGLRDIYSKNYRELSRDIDGKIIQDFIKGHNKTIEQSAKKQDNIKLCFAIMEVEAWFLAIPKIFNKLDTVLTNEFIKTSLSIDLETVDPEKEFYHPAKIVGNIYSLVNKKYDKKKGDIEAITNSLLKDDYQNLYLSDKCNSFKIFYDEIELL